MNVYAESSAVLAWLVDEPAAAEIGALLAGADVVLTSELTLIECERCLIRLVSWKQRTQAEAEQARARLLETTGHWTIVRLGAPVLDRARRRFPVEPIRTLDALHMATALLARQAVPQLVLLTLDVRLRDCGTSLGFEILPRSSPQSAT